MFAYRTKWHIKEGCVEDAVELVRGSIEYFKERGKVARVYLEPQVSPRSVLVWEEIWEDPEAHDAFWAEGSELQTSEEIKEFWPKWEKLVEGESKTEIWSLLK